MRRHAYAFLLCALLLAACGTAEPTAISAPPTATPKPAATDTGVPPSATQLPPTETATPMPTDTATPEATETLLPTDTPLPTDTAAPPSSHTGSGGGVIAFTSERNGNADIYLMNADGTDEQRLTDDPAYDAWPVWSPDGERIAFVSSRSGNPDIWVMDADGSNKRQLTDHAANDIWPSWSPDGTRIAFPSRRDGNFELYLINADGSNLQRLTDTPSHEDFPAWSPDGTRLVFTRSEGNDGTYVMDVPNGVDATAKAGSFEERKLLDFVALEPAWSPDGARIVFGSDHAGTRGIFVMDADGGNLSRLMQSFVGENCPDWSPDGNWIVFASWQGGDGEIYLMEADGSNVRALTRNRFEDEFPAWRPAPALREDGPQTAVMIHGGPYNDRAFDVLVTADGGTLVAGLADNTRPSHRITPGRAWLVRTSPDGTVLWEKEFGGEDDANFSSITPAGNDEYLLLGEIAGSYLREETDVYLVKVDGEGNELWSRTFGGRGMDLGKAVQQTADGGYIITGDQADEHPTGDLYQSNLYLIKTDAEGNLLWERTYGEEILYVGWGVAQAPDGGYVLAGWEARTYDERDAILLKTNGAGEVEWSHTWDFGERDGAFDLLLTSDGHIVLACIQSMGSGAPSAALIKADLDGNILWTKLVGEESVGNTLWHILEDADGGYLLAGDTHLGKIPGTGHERHGAWMVKTDADGEILWEHILGGEEYEQAHFGSVALAPDGGYVLVGDVTEAGKTYSDLLWVRVSPLSEYAGYIPVFEPAECQFPEPRGYEVECGYLTVPEDRSNPAGPQIRLHIAVFPSTADNPEPDPVIHLVGGPGGSLLDIVEAYLMRGGADILKKRDYIMFNQRGTHYAEPFLDCPGRTEFQWGLAEQELSLEERKQRETEFLLDCHDNLLQRGINLAAYNTAENAADVEDLRLALGYDQVNLYGISYGSRLALTVMRDYPEGVRSAIIDAVLPLQANLDGEIAPQAHAALKAVFEDCAADVDCNTAVPCCSQAHPGLEATFYRVIDQLNDEPVSLKTDGRTVIVDGYAFLEAFFRLLYSTDAIPWIPFLIDEAGQGAFHEPQIYGVPDRGAWGTGMHYSVWCREEQSFETQEEAFALAADLPPVFGELFADALDWEVCAAWGAGAADPVENEAVVSDIPTLVLSGRYDPVTPPSSGRQAAATLSNSFFYEFPNLAHGAMRSNKCARRIGLAFLDDPWTEPDASCMEGLGSPEFR